MRNLKVFRVLHKPLVDQNISAIISRATLQRLLVPAALPAVSRAYLGKRSEASGHGKRSEASGFASDQGCPSVCQLRSLANVLYERGKNFVYERFVAGRTSSSLSPHFTNFISPGNAFVPIRYFEERSRSVFTYSLFPFSPGCRCLRCTVAIVLCALD